MSTWQLSHDVTSIAEQADGPCARLFWLLLTVAIHTMWGMYPVAARWLQVRTDRRITHLSALFLPQQVDRRLHPALIATL